MTLLHHGHPVPHRVLMRLAGSVLVEADGHRLLVADDGRALPWEPGQGMARVQGWGVEVAENMDGRTWDPRGTHVGTR